MYSLSWYTCKTKQLVLYSNHTANFAVLVPMCICTVPHFIHPSQCLFPYVLYKIYGHKYHYLYQITPCKFSICSYHKKKKKNTCAGRTNVSGLTLVAQLERHHEMNLNLQSPRKCSFQIPFKFEGKHFNY